MPLTLERTANVLIIATALIVVPLGASRLYDRFAAPSPAGNPARYTQGEAFDSAVPVAFGDAQRAVVLYVSSTCKYCTNSMDFYRRLAEARAASDGRIKFIVVGGEQPDVLESYMKTHGVESDQRLQVAPGTTKLSGTPTLLILSRDRKVAGVWVGQLSADQEKGVFERLRG